MSLDEPSTFWGEAPWTNVRADPTWSVTRIRYLNGLDVGSFQAIVQAYRNTFVEHGRSSRRHLWTFFLFIMLVRVLTQSLVYLGFSASLWTQTASTIGAVLFFGSLPTMFFVVVRRFHDTNKGFFFFFVFLIPLVGNLLVLYWLAVQPGTAGPNRFTIEPNEKSENDRTLLDHLQIVEGAGGHTVDPAMPMRSTNASGTGWFNNVFSGEHINFARLSDTDISALQSNMFPGDKVRVVVPGYSDSKTAYFVLSEVAVYFLESPHGNPTVTTVFLFENPSWASGPLPEPGKASMELTWASNSVSIVGVFGTRELDQWEIWWKLLYERHQALEKLDARVSEKIKGVRDVFDATHSLFYEQGLALGRAEREFWDDLEQAYLYIIGDNGLSLFQSFIHTWTAPKIVSPDRLEAFTREVERLGSTGISDILRAEIGTTIDPQGSRKLYATTDITARRAKGGEGYFNDVNKRLEVMLIEFVTMFVEAGSEGAEDTRLSEIQLQRQNERVNEYIKMMQMPSSDQFQTKYPRRPEALTSISPVSQPAIAQGWYPDPSNTQQKRYWDGTQWTDQVAPL